MKTVSTIFPSFLVLLFAGLLNGCKSSATLYNPQQKYAPAALQKDYCLFRNILQTSHPSLYWYTPKDSMNYYFDQGYASIRDSMTETKFRMLLSYVVTKIDCGHTSIRPSKAFEKYTDTAKRIAFPFAIKAWSDTMVVTANLQRENPPLRRGTILKSVNGHSVAELRDTFFNYVTTDGYSICGKYQTLSTGFTFGSMYRNIYGLTDSFDIRYIDSSGMDAEKKVAAFNFVPDTATKKIKKEPKLIIFASANLQLDTTMRTAFMTLNTFDRSNHLRKFFRQSFASLQQYHIGNLIIDLRANGGGDAGISTLLTKYVINKKFKIADSLYTVSRLGTYHRYIKKSVLYRMQLAVATHKKRDGYYHFSYFERHYFKPKTKNHYDGQLYLLVGGNSFSATTLFAGAIKGQPNVTVVGEETGGGFYGNTAWIIPDVVLPVTRLQFRLPLFRMVIDKNRAKDGRGILPDVEALPTTEAIRQGIDFKAEKVRSLIESRAALHQ